MRFSTYARRFVAGIIFVGFYVLQLVQANLRVAADIVTPNHSMRPGVIALPIDAETDLEITLLGTLITLTPGSLALDVSSDRRFLYLHVMHLGDPEDFKRFEQMLLRVLR